ncbi:flavin reductase family protein [Caballeronia sp. LZ043]|uniref:flavin reductase family protein n=1 Tax=Caballeronia sp. LZ043 TaxID=3038569 RepID=UPI002863C7E8|nr:flavin reductase family protein [Caballeronia sp. LZ043]MDR5822335.1 flavin reductase family protein [Caballeronia sp. LZ043]
MSIETNTSAETFRHAMASFASGVTAVTTCEHGVPAGLIATSVCSLSVDPATVLVCVNKTASAHDVILRSRIFAVNLLAAGQKAVAQRFSSARGAERFEPQLWRAGKSGAPMLPGAAVAFDCTVLAVHDGFSHSIIVGQVIDAIVNDEAAVSCLLWHQRDFARSALETA